MDLYRDIWVQVVGYLESLEDVVQLASTTRGHRFLLGFDVLRQWLFAGWPPEEVRALYACK